MKLLGAVIIVKNEAKAIGKTLQSLVDAGVDAVTVIDTGSTDGTLAEVHRFPLGTMKLVSSEEPFTDYADTRNRALVFAAKNNPTVFTISPCWASPGVAA